MENLAAGQGSVWIMDASKHSYRAYQLLIGDLATSELFFSAEQVLKAITSINRSRPSVLICDLEGSDLGKLEQVFLELEDVHIIVVAKDSSRESMKKCFNAGVSDYFVHPVNENILLSKVEYYLGHEDTRNRDLDHFTSGIRLDGREIRDLTTKQVQLLALFIKSRTRTISREDILDQIWEDIQVHPKVVDVHIYNLRRKLGEYGFMIKSRGKGFWSLVSTQIRPVLNS